MFFKLANALLVCVLLSPSNAYSQQVQPLPVEELLASRSFAFYISLDLSPDGELVAYTLTDNRRKETQGDERYRVFSRTGVYFTGIGGDIWITNTSTGQSTNITGDRGNNWSPVWSPDGRYLAFYSDRDGQATTWVWEKASAKLRQVSKAIVRSLANPIVWTSDSQRVIVKLLPEGMTVEEAANRPAASQSQTKGESRTNGSTVTVYNSPKASGSTRATQQAPPWNFALTEADLAVIDVDRGKTERIVRGIPISRYLLSPDGGSIAYTTAKKFEGSGSQQLLFDLAVYSISTKQSRVVAQHIQLDYDGASFSWSPDGKTLSFRTGGMLAKSNVFVVPAAGGEARNLTAAPHPAFANYGVLPPLWDATGQNLYFIGGKELWRASIGDAKAAEVAKFPALQVELIALKGGNNVWSLDNGREAVVSVKDEETKRVGFHTIDLTTGKSSVLLEENKSYIYPPAYGRVVSDDGRHIVYLAQDNQHGQDLWLADSGFRNVKRITEINPKLERYKVGSARLIEWHGLDGEQLKGALLLPPDYQDGKRYPLIVKVYGGSSLSNDVNLFGFARAPVDNLQLLATRGYAVLLPDTKRGVGTPVEDLVKTTLPGVNKVIEMGIADPDRLGLMGHSNGGYGTLALITRTTRFKAAVMSAGLGNLIGVFGEMGKDGTSYGVPLAESIYIGGTPWDSRSKYIENSPVFFLDRVQTPLLIIHGGADDTIAPFLPDEVFVGLRRLGKEVAFAKYEGEGHWQGTWSYANQLDYLNRTVNWFDKYLKEPESKAKTTEGR